MDSVLFTAQGPPPAYDSVIPQTPANAYGFGQSGSHFGYGFTPTSFEPRSSPAAPQYQPQYGQNVQVNVVSHTVSPPVVIAQPASIIRSPSSYLGWSIFNFLCCFWPLGLAAIIYSVKVGSARNHEEAKSHSLTARNLNIAATTIAPIIAIVVGVALAAAGVTAVRHPSYYANPYYYYSYDYTTYYTKLMYYTYSNTYSYLDYSSFYSYYYGNTVYYSFTATGYQSVAASKYISDFYTKYAQGVYYSG